MSDKARQKTAKVPSEESLLAEYAEVNDNIRELTGIRFQLLAFLPVGTILGAFLLTSEDVSFRPVLALFGLAVTIGLMIYHERNDQIYGGLISRAKQLEQKLQLHDGQYNERVGVWQSLKLAPGTPQIRINHSTGINTIYLVSLVAWVYAILFELFSWIAEVVLVGNLGQAAPTDSSSLTNARTVAPAATALLLSLLGIWLAKRTLGAQQETRKEQMREDARQAISLLSELHAPQKTEEDKTWQLVYDYLLSVKLGSGLSEEEQKNAKANLEKRAKHYVNESEALPFTRETGGQLGEKNACFLANGLTDLPARWYMDTYTGRRA